MKIRCTSCHKVVKVRAGQPLRCPECGSQMGPTAPATQIENRAGTGQAASSSKGVLPRHSRTVEAVGCLVTVIVLGVAGGLASATGEHSGTAWLAVVAVAIVVTVAIGVWFHNQARR